MKQSLWIEKALGAGVATLVLLGGLAGCSTKNYVRSQTTPIINGVNELDASTAANHRAIVDTDTRAQAGISNAQGAADTANQHALEAGQSADAANTAAQEAFNRVDTLNGVVANLDNYQQISDVSVTFGFDKAILTKEDKAQLDDFAAKLNGTRGYILAVTGGTDSAGSAEYNYALSNRRADAVVTYLAAKFNVPPHKFYLIGIGKDQPAADNSTRTGRAENRRVEIKLLSNMANTGAAQPQAGS